MSDLELDLTPFEGHTPGPWSTDDAMGCVWGPDGSAILTGGAHLEPEVWANARLIAAAPLLLAEVRKLRAEREAAREVLAALEKALADSCGPGACMTQWHDDARVAIARAKEAGL